MCLKEKISVPQHNLEEIKPAKPADASTQKANVQNRTSVNDFVSPNIKTSNLGLDDDVSTSKKKLLGE
jgi:hypothetical protein